MSITTYAGLRAGAPAGAPAALECVTFYSGLVNDLLIKLLVLSNPCLSIRQERHQTSSKYQILVSIWRFSIDRWMMLLPAETKPLMRTEY